eukprot:TRINITY_DN19362_c0_g1_i1.p1 TRINITY_DN19362_c0_g1~~TRINITY_DN19362_c0_g1_i1.p1  ORF type:complete len:243 (-),score=44.17 TRINITY_DN19362_c0_g1_i1:96-824(-)
MRREAMAGCQGHRQGRRQLPRLRCMPKLAALGVLVVLARTSFEDCLTFFQLPAAFPAFPTVDNTGLKQNLLSAIEGTARGADMTEKNQEAIISVFEELEKRNPTAAPVASPLLKGDWELLWTTSQTILGMGRPGPFRPVPDKPILQFLDPTAGVARNLEDTVFGRNTVEAEIAPLAADKLTQFKSRLDNFLLFKYGTQESGGGTYMPEGPCRAGGGAGGEADTDNIRRVDERCRPSRPHRFP